jgi:hypothetical protein
LATSQKTIVVGTFGINLNIMSLFFKFLQFHDHKKYRTADKNLTQPHSGNVK